MNVSEGKRQRLWNSLHPNERRISVLTTGNPDDTITRAQLLRGLEARASEYNPPAFRGYQNLTQVVDAVMDTASVIAAASTRTGPKYNPNDSLTYTELEQALSDLRYSAHLASDIYVRVAANHEPKWKSGDIVKSGAGGVFIMQPSGRWELVGDERYVDFGYPVRPLTKIGEQQW